MNFVKKTLDFFLTKVRDVPAQMDSQGLVVGLFICRKNRHDLGGKTVSISSKY